MLYPGKGAHLVMNQEYLNFIDLVMSDIAACYSDETHDADPRMIITALTSQDPDLDLNMKWTEEADNFGIKAYASTPYKKGEFRITVVLTKQNELRLDIREWYPRD